MVETFERQQNQADYSPSSLPGSFALDLLAGWSKFEPQARQEAGSQPQKLDLEVKEGGLEISYNELIDLHGMPTLKQPCSVLRITGKPKDLGMLFWADNRGYYFFFDSKEDTGKFYLPAGIKTIDIDGKLFDVDRSRLQVNEYALARAAKSREDNPFATIKNNQSDAVSYFKRMSQVSDGALAWQEKTLRQGAQDSKNPYFRIYLADVLTIEAMKPLATGFMHGQVSDSQQKEALDKLDAAQKFLHEAADLSNSPLSRMNRYPPGNVAMPLNPGALLLHPERGYNPYFTFWGGAWEQANRREMALKLFQALVSCKAYNYFELPPA